MPTYPNEYIEEEEVANGQAHSPSQRQQNNNNSSSTVVVTHRQNTSGGHTLQLRYLPVVFLINAWIVVTLTIVAIVIDYVYHIKHMHVNMFILNIFCMLFSILALVAEARQFAELRAPLYVCIRYIYIITYPRFRAFFYIFLGTLLLDDTEAVLIAAAVVAMLNGVIILTISFICNIPSYYDVDEKFQSEQERVSYYSAKQRNSSSSNTNSNRNGNSAVNKTSSTKQSVSKTEMSHVPQSATSVVIENNCNSYASRTVTNTNTNTNINEQDTQADSKKPMREVQYGANSTNPLSPQSSSHSPFHSATNSSNKQHAKEAKPGTTRSSVTAHYASTSPLSTKRAQPDHSPDKAYAEYQKLINQK